MKRSYKVTWFVIFAIAIFFVGFYVGISVSSQELEERIGSLENENKELKSEIKEVNSSLNIFKEQCNIIKDESHNYVQEFTNKTCSRDSDCVEVEPPVSCGLCVHNSINRSKVVSYGDLFDNLRCEEAFSEKFSSICLAVATKCECIDNTCKSKPY